MLQVNARNLDKNCFWVNTREWQLEDDSIFKGLVENFASKAPGNYNLCLPPVEPVLDGHSFERSPLKILKKDTHYTGSRLRSVYTECQRQSKANAAMMLAIPVFLKAVELL